MTGPDRQSKEHEALPPGREICPCMLKDETIFLLEERGKMGASGSHVCDLSVNRLAPHGG